MITYVLKPRFCPNCGKPLKDVVTCQAVHGSLPPKRCFVKEAEIEFDCYCDACKWSGEISPDYRVHET